jgi:hypothetical protein
MVPKKMMNKEKANNATVSLKEVNNLNRGLFFIAIASAADTQEIRPLILPPRKHSPSVYKTT